MENLLRENYNSKLKLIEALRMYQDISVYTGIVSALQNLHKTRFRKNLEPKFLKRIYGISNVLKSLS